MLKFGYAFWGFLADRKFVNGREISAPDGNAAYSWSILREMQLRGWETYSLQRNRDEIYVLDSGIEAFRSFSDNDRLTAYLDCKKTQSTNGYNLRLLRELPHLDIVLIEWRWPIPGRNSGVTKFSQDYQPDLDRQIELLNFFKDKDTKIILWDLDHKLTIDDEMKWEPDAIFETAVEPRKLHIQRTRVEPPIFVDDLMQWSTLPASSERKLVYVGSRYERDDVIEEWIKPISNKFPFQVEFWGNWEQTIDECREMWPNVLYNRRITMSDFRDVYSTAVSCPLLGKRSYLQQGFVTPRIWEALLFGTIPIGLSCHKGIEDYVLFTVRDPNDLIEIVEEMSCLDVVDRDILRRENIERIRFMDVSNFVNKIEEIL